MYFSMSCLYKIYNLEMPLYRYRMHENNRTKDIEEVEKFDKANNDLSDFQMGEI